MCTGFEKDVASAAVPVVGQRIVRQVGNILFLASLSVLCSHVLLSISSINTGESTPRERSRAPSSHVDVSTVFCLERDAQEANNSAFTQTLVSYSPAVAAATHAISRVSWPCKFLLIALARRFWCMRSRGLGFAAMEVFGIELPVFSISLTNVSRNDNSKSAR
jgi:hypothetical protein